MSSMKEQERDEKESLKTEKDVVENESKTYKKMGGNEKTFEGKKYVKFVDEEFAFADDTSQDDKEKDEEDDLKEKTDADEEEIDYGCCWCSPQSRNIIFGGIFAVLTNNAIIFLEYEAYDEDVAANDKFLHRTAMRTAELYTCLAWMRAAVCIFALARAVQLFNLLLLAGTVKRNAIYVYPWLTRYHVYLILTSVLVHMLDAGVFFMKDVWAVSWVEVSIVIVNCVASAHGLLLVCFQYTNGTMNCADREMVRVEGDEVVMEEVQGYSRLKICDNNKGVIATELPEDYFEFSLV